MEWTETDLKRGLAKAQPAKADAQHKLRALTALERGYKRLLQGLAPRSARKRLAPAARRPRASRPGPSGSKQ